MYLIFCHIKDDHALVILRSLSVNCNVILSTSISKACRTIPDPIKNQRRFLRYGKIYQ